MDSLTDLSAQPAIVLFKNPVDPHDRQIFIVDEGTIFFDWLFAHYPDGFGRPIIVLRNGVEIPIELTDFPMVAEDVVSVLIKPAGTLAPILVSALVSLAIAATTTIITSLIFGKPKGTKAAPDPDPVYSLSGGANQARLGAPIPVIYGEVITTPDYVAPPYAFYQNNDQFIDQVLCIGQGEFDVADILISDTPVSSLVSGAIFTAIYPASAHLETIGTIEAQTGISETMLTSVEVSDIELSGSATGQPVTRPVSVTGNFNNSRSFTITGTVPVGIVAGQSVLLCQSTKNFGARPVSAVSGNVLTLTGPLTASETGVVCDLTVQTTAVGIEAGPFVTAPPGYAGDMIYLDFVAPNGQYNADKNTGDLADANISFSATFQQIDDDGNNVGAPITQNPNWTAATNTPQRRTFGYAVPAGRYKVTITRLTPTAPNSYTVNNAVWTGLRTRLVLTNNPVYGNTTLLAIRIRATSGLSSDAANRIRVKCTRKLPLLGTGALTATTSPADAFIDAIINQDYGARRSLSTVDMDTIPMLKAHWGSDGQFNGVFSTQSTVWEALQIIGQVVAAAPAQVGSKTTLIQDNKRAVSTQIFSSANMRADSFSILYGFDRPGEFEGYQVEYRDPNNFNAAYVTYPTDALDYETVTLMGCTSQQLAGYFARLLWNRRLYRRREVDFTSDLEGLLPVIGDRVTVSNEIVEWGTAGELAGYTAGAPATLVLDRPIDWSLYPSPVIVLRNDEGQPSAALAVTPGDDGMTITVPSLPFTPAVQPCDQQATLWAIGNADEVTRYFTVTDLEHSGGSETKISGVIYDERVWTGTFPFQSVAI